ncbi:CIA30 family protein [Muriicola sp. Z0-33]|uniref:CIA30 family protein n=1 Tax=Muriicola sp. Z0-33 TaxID=2816957 RepID=UPI002237B4AE|nr:CIA30 family protein [Muriicola sp. Z0-33]MCW5515475.1 CIA30 family protein [Muriicola sp. Z0-33]
MQSHIIVDFNKANNQANWTVVDDVVMGGRSAGSFYINEKGQGVFHGKVSLENNGGFSSLRYRFKKITTTPYTKVVLRIKGDGKTYQFRVKKKSTDYYSYISYFQTSNDWETIELPLKDMYPTFRGRKLDSPNYSADGIEEIAFLIGNKRAESFKLEIDTISLK